MITIDNEVAVLQKKFDAAKAEEQDIERWKKKLGLAGGENNLSVQEVSKEIAQFRMKHKMLTK